ncbi:MAG: hypothetical protein HY866_14055, partial [Chloroflexi bacterium]|nr:hypothetical protein [Chloroflexota bacterium]
VLAAIAPGRVSAGGNIGPRNMLIQYYSLINSRQYSLAYQQWVNPVQTYQDFVNGYATTASVSTYFGGFQPEIAGGITGAVPAILVGVDIYGQPTAYSGCYFLRYNDTSSGLGLWSITGANFAQTQVAVATASQEILKGIDCYNHHNIYGVYDTPEYTLSNYYQLVNLADYASAYAHWIRPSQTYQQFVTGWADTSETVLFYGSYQSVNRVGAAETGRIPVVLFGYHNDGSLVGYQGCIGIGFNANVPGGWGLAAAYLRPMVFTTTPDDWTISQALSARCY